MVNALPLFSFQNWLADTSSRTLIMRCWIHKFPPPTDGCKAQILVRLFARKKQDGPLYRLQYVSHEPLHMSCQESLTLTQMADATDGTNEALLQAINTELQDWERCQWEKEWKVEQANVVVTSRLPEKQMLESAGSMFCLFHLARLLGTLEVMAKQKGKMRTVYEHFQHQLAATLEGEKRETSKALRQLTGLAG